MEVVASLSQGRTAAAQCGLFTHKSVPVIFEPPCIVLHKAAHEIYQGVCYSKCHTLSIPLNFLVLLSIYEVSTAHFLELIGLINIGTLPRGNVYHLLNYCGKLE